MALEFRPTNKPHSFDLYEGDEMAGELEYCPPEDDDDEPRWFITVWSAMGTGKDWQSDSATSHEEAAEHAREMYEERDTERRELKKAGRIWTSGSIPMGGKSGWRRR